MPASLRAAVACATAHAADYQPPRCHPIFVARLPAIHLVFGLVKRWLLGTHQGAVSAKHLQAYLDEHVFRFNRRTAKSPAHRFARLVQHAVQTRPTTYHQIVHGAAA